MVHLDPGRAARESAHELVVDEVRLAQGPQVRIAYLAHRSLQLLQELANVVPRMGQEVGQLDPARVVFVQRVGNELKGALEELNLSLHLQEVTGLEGAEDRLARVPHAGVDRARAVAEVELDVEV